MSKNDSKSLLENYEGSICSFDEVQPFIGGNFKHILITTKQFIHYCSA